MKCPWTRPTSWPSQKDGVRASLWPRCPSSSLLSRNLLKHTLTQLDSGAQSMVLMVTDLDTHWHSDSDSNAHTHRDHIRCIGAHATGPPLLLLYFKDARKKPKTYNDFVSSSNFTISFSKHQHQAKDDGNCWSFKVFLYWHRSMGSWLGLTCSMAQFNMLRYNQLW